MKGITPVTSPSAEDDHVGGHASAVVELQDGVGAGPVGALGAAAHPHVDPFVGEDLGDQLAVPR